MNIYIYESSSRGGCYEYSKYLLHYYLKTSENALLIIPENSPDLGNGISKILLSDIAQSNSKLFRKLHFLYRQFANPFILFFFLLFKPKSIVILNDFEQLTAPIWAPLYRLFLRKHKLVVVLHDPDRDNYPPSKKFSEICMKFMMNAMDFGLYHEYLPDKKYYGGGNTKYLNVPHGIYKASEPDLDLVAQIKKDARGNKIMAIIGNIREEKNYDLVIKALADLPDWTLLIAGAESNSTVSLEYLKRVAIQNKVEDRIIWVNKFLSNSEMASVIIASDLLLLYYKRTFTSQSGILNLIAPYSKKVLMADISSCMTDVARRFGLALLIKPDNAEDLLQGIKEFDNMPEGDWLGYNAYASWDNHVNLVLKALTELKK